MTELAASLLPVLHRSLEARFNVFDVMHHGTHEKQISNVFRWLLDAEGTHRLGDRFLRIFIDEVNRGLAGREHLEPGAFLVLQEVSTSLAGGAGDIADLVLENDDAVIVVENYFTSDGHGHGYDRYLRYSERDGRRGAVVLLCQEQDSGLQTDGWQNASVVTYGRLVDRLRLELERDGKYRRKHPEPYSFIDQMHRKFVKGSSPVEDQQVLGFVVAMCEAGEAGRYGEQPISSSAERFANEVAEQARERFGEGRELLGKVKTRLRAFSADVLRGQLNATLGDGFVSGVSARYSGIYQWTVNFAIPDDDGAKYEEHRLQLKFGPSAWYANEKDGYWTRKVPPEAADYSRLFLTRVQTKEVRQSEVTLQEVLDGLARDDSRLHDEILRLLRGID